MSEVLPSKGPNTIPVCCPLLQMVDVGCGIGGSSRYISRKFGASAEGITLSSVQAARANELSTQQGLGQQCNFQVGDWVTGLVGGYRGGEGG
jgi:trans-aconitate methyltransferase